jgi:arylsulfatase A-like enzyme
MKRLPTLWVLLAALPAALAGAAGPASGRPNILFIMSDDHAAQAVSAYGSRVNQTPHIDRLAREGLRFDRCYCVNSICAPSRASILTGKYSHRNGVPVFNRFDGSQPHVARYLHAAGYHTGVIGKWHLGSDPTGFDEWCVLPGQGAYFDPAFLDRSGRRVIPGYVSDIITDLAIEFLEHRPRDRPFFLMCHHKAPHRPWEPDASHKAQFAGRSIPEPPTLWDDYATRSDAIRECAQKVSADLTRRDLKLEAPADLTGQARNRWLNTKPTAVDIVVDGARQTLTGQALDRWKYQRYLQDYLACVQSVDDNVGRLLDWLDRQGLRENTLVVYTSDQGFFLGEHGLYDKRFMYEESLRMPFLVRWPAGIRPESHSSALALNVDFAPTFLDLAGLEIPLDMQGRSLRPLFGGQRPADWRHGFYYRYYHDPGDHNTRAHYGIRTDTHKLIRFWKSDQWEMFDLVRDPLEMTNLYSVAAEQTTVAALKQELDRLKREVQDDDRFATNQPPAGVDGPFVMRGNPGVPWPATDALGRTLPMADEVGPLRTNRFVGMFYFLWHNNRGGRAPNQDGPYDIDKIVARDPEALSKPGSALWGPVGMYHYWGEPLYGYYLSTDPWVLRRHAQLLADAGIDVLIFDATNALTYRDEYTVLCEVFRQVRHEGGRAPHIAFMVNTEAGATAQRLYQELYKPGLYRELWFNWQGRPLLVCDPAQASPELRAFFTLRRAHWPFEMINTANAWHWEAAFPQPYGFTDDPARAEQVNVSVAQNLRRQDGKVTNMSSGEARGRSFHAGRVEPGAEAVNRGYNFEEQWQRAFELNPPFVLVTGWNEWIAGRWGQPEGPLVFVDQFTQEYSRDIEPARASHGDNYYWQLVANVRRYKGAAPLPAASAPKTIRVAGGFAQWQDVGPEFADHWRETDPRDFDGAGGTHYTNRTGRNDLDVFKVARDDDGLYFYARTRGASTPPSDPFWMWLLLDTDHNASTGWRGCDFLVNRERAGAGEVWLERNTGGWTWERVAKVGFRAEGNELQIAIPKRVLGLTPGAGAIALDFKWADNWQHPEDPLDPYVSGDTAPEGRFFFRYQAP